ncbi:MAG TPA: alpha/beta hydrolase [Rubrobacteraceae bacterium]|nr:alpha/beta hydrolase [Rubrobacteraceae bacterium]
MARAPPPRVLNVSRLSDALAAWMGTVGLKSAVLVGNSFGCQIIVDLATRNPKRVERTALQGPTMDHQGRSVLRQIARFLLNGTREPLYLNPIMLLDALDASLLRG